MDDNNNSYICLINSLPASNLTTAGVSNQFIEEYFTVLPKD